MDVPTFRPEYHRVSQLSDTALTLKYGHGVNAPLTALIEVCMGLLDFFKSKCCVDDGDGFPPVIVNAPNDKLALARHVDGHLKHYLDTHRIGDYLSKEENYIPAGEQASYVVPELERKKHMLPVLNGMDRAYWESVYNKYLLLENGPGGRPILDVGENRDGTYVRRSGRKRKCLWCHESVAIINKTILDSGYQGKYEIVECGQALHSGHWIVVVGRQEENWDNITLGGECIVLDIWGRLGEYYYDGVMARSIIYPDAQSLPWAGTKRVRTRIEGGVNVARAQPRGGRRPGLRARAGNVDIYGNTREAEPQAAQTRRYPAQPPQRRGVRGRAVAPPPPPRGRPASPPRQGGGQRRAVAPPPPPRGGRPALPQRVQLRNMSPTQRTQIEQLRDRGELGRS